MNERLKLLRSTLDLNQREFSKKTKIPHSTIAMFETGQRIPKDIHIDQICQTFNVNQHWLLDGDGDMFIETDDTVITQLCTEFDLDNVDRQMIETYINMSDSERATLKKFIHSVAMSVVSEESVATVSKETSNVNYINEEVEAYRAELEAEEKGRLALQNLGEEKKA